MQTNNSTIMNVTSSLLSEASTDLETLKISMHSNDSQKSVLDTKLFLEAFEQLFPYSNYSVNNQPSANPRYIQNPLNILPTNLQSGLYPILSNLTKDDVAFVGIRNGSLEALEYPCNLISNKESDSYKHIAFILELIIQPIFICIGFFFNTIAINILRR